MISVMVARVADDLVPVPRSAVRFPLELSPPPGFVAEQPDTWPVVEGQLEFVGGKLYFMPPSADRQQDTSADVVTVLGVWRKLHPEFVVAGNEAGMILAGEARGADAAVWRRRDLGAYDGKYRRVAPVLAVEVQGELEDETALRSKAGWYLSHGVQIVWLLFPSDRRLIVMTARGELPLRAGDTLPDDPALPELTTAVDELFTQVSGL